MGDTTLELTEGNFEQTLEKGGILLIDFWASWCGPCRAFAPVYESVAAKNPDITFAKVNSDEQQQLSALFEVSAIPTLAIFRDKVLIYSQAGAMGAGPLEKLVQQVRELDMAKVHEEIAKKGNQSGPSA